MKRFIFILLALIFIVGFSAHVSTKKAKRFANQQDNVNIVPVTKGDINEDVVAVGNIEPQQVIQVRSPISGTVSTIFHDTGDYVNAGEQLLQVQPQPAPADYATAKQQVAEDAVAEKTASDNLQRYQFLLKNKAIAPDDQDFATAKQAYATAKLTTQLDQQKLALLEKGVASIDGKTIANIITAPISGYILQRNVDLGGTVTGQSSAQQGNNLFTIADMKNLWFVGQVSEIDVAKIQKNMSAVLTIAAIPNQKITGMLTNISLDSVQDAASNSGGNSTSTSNTNSTSPFNVGFNVWISNLNLPTNTRLLAGYSATAKIRINSVKNVLTLPERALMFDDDNNPYVFLAGGDKNNPTEQKIQIGISDGMNVQVLSGLKEGQAVLVSNATQNNS